VIVNFAVLQAFGKSEINIEVSRITRKDVANGIREQHIFVLPDVG
jgi:hypothetical protein